MRRRDPHAAGRAGAAALGLLALLVACLLAPGSASAADATPPVASVHAFVPATNAQYQHVTGTTIHVNPLQSGSFDLEIDATDAESGMDRVVFPSLGTGWDAPSPAFDDSALAPPYRTTYGWSAPGVVAPASPMAIAFDNDGNQIGVPLDIRLDASPPGGSSIAYDDGVNTSGTISIDLDPGADSGSGIATWQVQRRHGPGGCASFGPWADIGGADPASPLVDPSLDDDTCYQYRLLVTDNVGNVRTSVGSAHVDVLYSGQITAFHSFVELFGQPNQHAVGSTMYVRPGQSGSFTARVRAIDPDGIVHVEFPPLGTGWSPSPLDPVVVPTSLQNGPVYSHSYTWSPSAAAPETAVVAWSEDSLANQTGASFAVVADSTAPSGGSIDAPDAVTSATSVDVTFGIGTDAQSGIATHAIERRSSLHSAGGCPAYGQWIPVALEPAPGTWSDSSLADEHCFQYRLRVTDNVGNVATHVHAGAVRIDRIAPSVTISNELADPFSGSGPVAGTALDLTSGVHSVHVEYDGPSGSDVICAAAPVVDGAWSCPWDTSLLDDGAYEVTATATDHASNPSSSPAVRVVDVINNDVPSAAFVEAQPLSGAAHQHAAGSTVHVNPAHPGSFRVVVEASSASGVREVEFPDLSGAAGWSPVGVQVDDTADHLGRYSADYEWEVGAHAPASPVVVTVHARSGATTTAVFDVELDPDAPVGGSISTSRVATGIAIEYSPGTDAGSGIDQPLVQRRMAIFDGQQCGAFEAWGGVVTPASPFVDASVVGASCYQYRLVSRDNVGNLSVPVEDGVVHRLAPTYEDPTPPVIGRLVVLPGANPSAQRWDGTTLWFNPATSGSFRVRAFVGDVQSGVASVVMGPFGAGLAPGPTSFESSPYETTVAWSPGAPSSAAYVVATNGAGATSSVPMHVVADAEPPSGLRASLSPHGSSGTVPVKVEPGADAGSGLSNWKLQRRTALLKGKGCNPYGAFITIAEGAGEGRTHRDNVGLATCNEWRVVSTDEVGNVAVSEAVEAIVRRIIRGTRKNDRLMGTAGPDLISGLAGNDVIYGLFDDDVLSGGPGNDRLFGGPGNDRLIGGPGQDRLVGGPGNDLLEGGPGNDVLIGGPGRDTILAGPGSDRVDGGAGNDLIGVRDGVRDFVKCGPGRDTVIADWLDVVARDCERVVRKSVPRPGRR